MSAATTASRPSSASRPPRRERSARLGLEVELVVELARGATARSRSRSGARPRPALDRLRRLDGLGALDAVGAGAARRARACQASSGSAATASRTRSRAVVPVHVERVGQQLEDGVAPARDVGRLLAQQLADLGSRRPRAGATGRAARGCPGRDRRWRRADGRPAQLACALHALWSRGGSVGRCTHRLHSDATCGTSGVRLGRREGPLRAHGSGRRARRAARDRGRDRPERSGAALGFGEIGSYADVPAGEVELRAARGGRQAASPRRASSSGTARTTPSSPCATASRPDGARATAAPRAGKSRLRVVHAAPELGPGGRAARATSVSPRASASGTSRAYTTVAPGAYALSVTARRRQHDRLARRRAADRGHVIHRVRHRHRRRARPDDRRRRPRGGARAARPPTASAAWPTRTRICCSPCSRACSPPRSAPRSTWRSTRSLAPRWPP